MAKVFIIGGLGHIGLTLGAVLGQYHQVYLYDKDEEAKMLFQAKRCASFYEPSLNSLLKNSNCYLTENLEGAADCDYIIITIGTPIDEYFNPILKNIFDISRKLSRILTEQTVILRSTVFPGLTKKISKLFSEYVKIAYAPERVSGGKMIEELQSLPQIVAADDETSLNSASTLFKSIGVELKQLNNTTEAELAKLYTNAYRYIHFAIANQFFMIAEDESCDFYKIYDAVCDNYPRMKSFPRPGFTAGYCLRKDSLQLASTRRKNTLSLAYDASIVNEYLPLWVFRKMREKYSNLEEKIVGILGLSFKPGTDDTRDSLSFRMKKILENEVKEVITYDPYVSSNFSVDKNAFLKKADIIVLMTPHEEYRSIKTNKPIIDIWNFFKKETGL